MNAHPEQREVHFSGSVQGVGFRFTVCQIAHQFPVVGYVENLLDGRVRMVAEGSKACLDGFLIEINRVMAGNITDRSVDKHTATGEFSDFKIRR